MAADKLENIIKIAEDQHFDTLLTQAESLQKMQQKNDFVEVVVLGQFKAGKSSLINSFLKDPVLPVGVLPVTAVITRLGFRDTKKAYITYLNGNREEIPVNKIEDFITEKDNPENMKQVQLVDIELPELRLFKNIRFIDTPGMGSVYKHNTEVTQNWYKNIGAAIVVISATQPLSENDMELIRSATEQSPVIHLVLSKTDLLVEQELNDVHDFIKTKVFQEFGKNFPIFLYSTVRNTSKYRQRIIVEIFKKLSGRAHETNKQIFNHKLQYLSKLTKSYLEISLQLQNKKDTERRALKDKIIDQQLDLVYVKRELSYITNDYKTATRKKLEKLIVDKYQTDLIRGLSQELDQKYNDWKGNLSKVSASYESWIRKSMSQAMLKVDYSEKADMQQFLDETCRHLNHYLSGFRERLNQNLQKVLGVTIPDDHFEVEVKLMEKANISVSWAFESHIDLLWFLIPMFMFRNTFRKYFLKQIPREVERNLHRLVSLLTNNMHQIMDELHLQSVNYIVSELDKIEQLLRATPSGSQQIKEQISLLEESSKLN